MASGKPPEYKRGLETAFRLCTEAIDMLDACGAPPTVAPHIEAAIQEIRRVLEEGGSQARINRGSTTQ
jgi:hypothetical protein